MNDFTPEIEISVYDASHAAAQCAVSSTRQVADEAEHLCATFVCAYKFGKLPSSDRGDYDVTTQDFWRAV